MEFKISHSPVEYSEAVQAMEERVRAIRAGEAEELIWLLEHPPLYTAGTSAKASDLLDNKGFPVYETGRGGQYTYHGPGQRVVYVMLDLKKRKPDVRWFVQQLEVCIITALDMLGVKGEIRDGRVGVWVRESNNKESKIAALGIRIWQWVTYHGVAINIAPDLSHYDGIIPCGIAEYGVTSFAALGIAVSREEFDRVFLESFKQIFG